MFLYITLTHPYSNTFIMLLNSYLVLQNDYVYALHISLYIYGKEHERLGSSEGRIEDRA